MLTPAKSPASLLEFECEVYLPPDEAFKVKWRSVTEEAWQWKQRMLFELQQTEEFNALPMKKRKAIERVLAR